MMSPALLWSNRSQGCTVTAAAKHMHLTFATNSVVYTCMLQVMGSGGSNLNLEFNSGRGQTLTPIGSQSDELLKNRDQVVHTTLLSQSAQVPKLGRFQPCFIDAICKCKFS